MNLSDVTACQTSAFQNVGAISGAEKNTAHTLDTNDISLRPKLLNVLRSTGPDDKTVLPSFPFQALFDAGLNELLAARKS